MKQILSHRRSEDGWALVTAMVVMALMLAIGLALLARADTQQSLGRQERVRESSFNLAEGSLYGVSQILAKNWPYTPADAFPAGSPGTGYVTCDETSGSSLCPDKSLLTTATSGGGSAVFSTADYGSNVQWRLYVRDNGDPALGNSANGTGSNPTATYVRSVADAAQGACAAPCTWDANGDKRVWVRAEATVRGKTRRMVALLQLEQTNLSFAANVLSAGVVTTGDSGNKAIIGTADGATASQVIVRACNVSGNPPAAASPCSIPKTNQVSPDNMSQNANQGNAMTDATRQAIEAGADHTYTSCPSPNTVAAWTGIVVLNTPSSANCQILGANSYGSPGIIIMHRGTLSIQNNDVYYGFIYHTNDDHCGQSPDPAGCPAGDVMFRMSGNPKVIGGVGVDGLGVANIGRGQGGQSCDPNPANGNQCALTFYAAAFSGGKAVGTAGLVQNTWRELTPGQ